MLNKLFNRHKKQITEERENITMSTDHVVEKENFEVNINDKIYKEEMNKSNLDDKIEEIELYIKQFLSNVIFPSLILLPYYKSELLQKWLADSQGINFEVSEFTESFYNNDFKLFLTYLKTKDINITSSESKFLDILTSIMDDMIYQVLYDEYFEILNNEETLEDCIFKYLEINNFDEGLYNRIVHLRFLRRFLSIKNYTKEVIKESTVGIDPLAKIIKEILEKYKFELKMNSFENKIENNNEFYPTIEYVDLMDGQEFEIFLADLFQRLGYRIEITKKTGDQGVDLIIYKNNQSVAVQAKKYSTTVGNFAIQQVVAGQQYYDTDKTIVVTNNYFTKSCIELAQSTNTILWDRDKLDEMIRLTY